MKKKTPKIITISEQYIDFFENTEVHELNYSETLYKLLTDLNENDLINVIYYLELKNPQHYENLSNELDRILIENPDNKIKLLGFKTKSEIELLEMLEDNEKMKPAEHFMPLLINTYINLNNPKHLFFKPIYQTFLLSVNTLILKQISYLKAIYDAEKVKNIDFALNLFFIPDEDQSKTKFIKYIARELEIGTAQLYLWRTTELFFDKLSLSYIPQLSYNQKYNKFNVDLLEGGISRSELFEIINSDDHFNNKLPLANVDENSFLQYKRNYSDKEMIISIFRNFFIKELDIKDEIIFNSNVYSIAHVFFENLCDPYNAHEKNLQIYVRDKIKDNISDSINEFIALLFCFKIMNFLTNSTRKIPLLVSEYFGSSTITSSNINKVFGSSYEKLNYEMEIAVNHIEKRYFSSI